MGDLRVVVRFHGELVEDRVLAVDSAVRLGDGYGARVVFPGASLLVARDGEVLEVRGRRLREGDRSVLSLGAVSVELEHMESARFRPRAQFPFDASFLMVVLGVAVGSMWVDLGVELLRGSADSEQLARSQKARFTTGAELSAEQLAVPEALQPGEGREARPDDDRTGWSYYAWYRGVVPPSIVGTELARYQLESNPDDLNARAEVARGAYENENYREALLQYAQLVRNQPHNARWLEGLALTRKRLGHHRDEIRTWDRLLQLDPEHLHARGNLAIALARLGDYEGAETELDRLRPALVTDAYLRVFFGIYEAIRGREVDAIAELEGAVSQRATLSEALQVELMRDLALDPVLHNLRADPRLRSMLYRHFGAAAPQPALPGAGLDSAARVRSALRR